MNKKWFVLLFSAFSAVAADQNSASLVETSQVFQSKYPGIRIAVGPRRHVIEVIDDREVKVTPVLSLTKSEESTVLCAVHYLGCEIVGESIIDHLFRVEQLPQPAVNWGLTFYSMDLNHAEDLGKIRFVSVFQLVPDDSRIELFMSELDGLRLDSVAELHRTLPTLNTDGFVLEKKSFLVEASTIMTQLGWIPQSSNVDHFNCAIAPNETNPRCALQLDVEEPPVGYRPGWAQALSNDLIRKGAVQTLNLNITLKAGSVFSGLGKVTLLVPIKNIDILPFNSSVEFDPHFLDMAVSND